MDGALLTTERVAEQTQFFHSLAQADELFGAFRRSVPERSLANSKIVGALWFHLSEAIVDILCIALARLNNPKIRHFVVQTAYEELGEDSPDKLHTKLLLNMLQRAGVNEQDILRWSGHEGVNREIDKLKKDLWDSPSDVEICGILLGMEIIAYQNVDNVLDYLSSSEDVGAAVRATEWAKLHHQLEEGHSRRAVTGGVEHVPDLTSQRRCVAAFMRTIRFWRQFWAEIADATCRPPAEAI